MANFLTTTQVADMLGTSAQTIRNWVRMGILRGYRLNPSGRLLIKLEDVANAVDKGRILVDEDYGEDEE